MRWWYGGRLNRVLWWVIAILAAVDLAAIIAGFFVHVEEYRGKLCYYASVFPGYDSAVESGTFYFPLA